MKILSKTSFVCICVLLLVIVTFDIVHAWTISGTVNGGSSSLPDAKVTAYNADLNEIGSSITDSNGNYTISAANGTYKLVIEPPITSGFATSTVYGVVVNNADIGQNVVLVQQARYLRGTVKTKGGTAVAKVLVSVLDQSSGTVVGSQLTDSQGAYSIPLSDGTYKINVKGGPAVLFDTVNCGGYCISNVPTPQYFEYYSLASNVSITGDVTLNLILPLATLSGKATDTNGVPVVGVKITQAYKMIYAEPGNYSKYYVTQSNYSHLPAVQSNGSGDYLLGMIEGAGYSLTIAPPENSGFSQSVLNDVEVAGPTIKDILLQQARHLSGTVKTKGGTAVAKILVSVLDQSSGTVVGSQLTDSQGAYSIPLSDGTYKINVKGGPAVLFDTVNCGGYCISNVPTPQYFEYYSLASNVSITGDVTLNLILPLATLSGKATDANGVPVAGVKITQAYKMIYAEPGNYSKYYVTQSNYSHLPAVQSNGSGDYLLGMIEGAGYSLTITPPENSGFSQTVLNQLTVNSTLLQNIILSYPDTVDPTILAGPTVSAISDTAAVIEWQTNEPTTGSVRFGLSNPPTTEVAATTAKTIHSLSLTGLTADTLYYVKVEATDTSNNGPTTSTVISFRTKPTPDTKPPVIIEGPTISSITHAGAVVEWTTDEPSRGSVHFGTTESTDSTFEESGLSTTHRMTLSGLGAETLHYLKVTARDGAGNGPTTSPLVSFTTQAAPDTTAPVIVEGPLAVNVSDSEATIIWKTDEPATSGVSWNDGTAYGLITDETVLLDHNLRITGLKASTTYNFTVSSKDSFGNGPSLSKAFTFTTPAAADTFAPVVIEGPLVVNVTHQSAVIRWETDEPADSVIEYGTTTSFGESDSRASLTKPHNLTLTGLAAGTTYYFRVRSRDASGNVRTAEGPYSFTTDAEPGSNKPVLTVEPQIIHQTDTTTTIYWETDKPTDTVVDYGKGSSKDKQRAEAARTTKHQITLVNLEPQQGYGLSISSTDLEGNTIVADAGTPITRLASRFLVESIISDAVQMPAMVTGFTTAAAPDTVPPVIASGPSVTVTDRMATIRWSTDEISDSRVEYGIVQPLGTLAGNIRQVKEHLVVLTNLLPNTTYSFRVASVDPVGNGPVRSGILSFTTNTSGDSAGPVFTVVPAVGTPGETGVTVTWSTDEPATTQVRYGLSRNQLLQQKAVPGLTSDHRLVINGLQPGTTYYLTAVSVDGTGNSSQSEPLQFTTASTVPAANTLAVTIAGSGSGSVNSTPAGIACMPGTTQGCAVSFASSEKVVLQGVASMHSVFSGWSGDCTGSGGCEVTMNAPRAVTATFTVDPATIRIDGDDTPYYAIGPTVDSLVQTGKILRLRNRVFLENLIMSTPVTVLLKGGYADTAFTTRGTADHTVVDGFLKVRKGTVRIERLKIR